MALALLDGSRNSISDTGSRPVCVRHIDTWYAKDESNWRKKKGEEGEEEEEEGRKEERRRRRKRRYTILAVTDGRWAVSASPNAAARCMNTWDLELKENVNQSGPPEKGWSANWFTLRPIDTGHHGLN